MQNDTDNPQNPTEPHIITPTAPTVPTDTQQPTQPEAPAPQQFVPAPASEPAPMPSEEPAQPPMVTEQPVSPETTPEPPSPPTPAAPAKPARHPFVAGIWTLAGLLSVVLGLRFLFHLVAIDPNNVFVDKLYTYTHPLLAPLFSLFQHNEELIDRRFEYENLIAIAVILLVAWGVAAISRVFARRAK